MAIDKAVDSTVLDGYFEDIADAIRDKDGTQNTYTPAQMPTAIENIPSGGSSHDWEALGFSGEPEFIQDAYAYAAYVKENNLSYFKADKKMYIMPSVNLQYKSLQDSFNNTPLSAIALFDTSNVTTFRQTFYASYIKTIPLFDTSSVTTFYSTFQGCENLTSVPALDVSKATTLFRMFSGCVNLVDVPVFNPEVATNMQQTFTSCNSLSDASLDNILKTCINAVEISASNKTLAYIGINSSIYSASKIQSLPSYQAFLNAGWTIGF